MPVKIPENVKKRRLAKQKEVELARSKTEAQRRLNERAKKMFENLTPRQKAAVKAAKGR